MAENSKIEWTHHTFNAWRGCTKVSAGCANCYAEAMSKRNPATLGVWGDNGTRVVAVDSYWKQPLKWNRDAEKAGERRRVFCASLADVFEDRPELRSSRQRLFRLIDDTPHLDWLLLTKRPENLRKLYPPAWDGAGSAASGCPENVWLGITVENQEQANKRIPHLLQVPARVHFLSCEPLLGPIDLHAVTALDGDGPDPMLSWIGQGSGIDWVICGGESGPNARPMHPDWARGLRDQCTAARVPFFFKQWGEWRPIGIGADEHGTRPMRMGKKMAGRMLDGREWSEFPNDNAK